MREKLFKEVALLCLMEYNPIKREIIVKRKLNKLDEFVLDFVGSLESYVIVSGYVSILLGRSRATEDIDLLIPKIGFSDFQRLWKKLNEEDFECLNTYDVKEAHEMLDEFAIRFSRKGKAIPNMEFKMISNDLQKYSFDKKIKVVIEDKILYISPLEMQITYKLLLGSNKDLEDAKHIYELFKEKLDKDELTYLVNELKVKDNFEKIK